MLIAGAGGARSRAIKAMRMPLPISCGAGRCPKVLMQYSLYWRQYLMLKE